MYCTLEQCHIVLLEWVTLYPTDIGVNNYCDGVNTGESAKVSRCVPVSRMASVSVVC